MLVAVEQRRAVRTAVNTLHRKFARGSDNITGLGNTTYWHEKFGIWGHFSELSRPDGSKRPWNAFGIVRHLPRDNIIVEINPSTEGPPGNMQGVIARTAQGDRWLLHRGQISIPGQVITAAQFAAITRLPTRAVNYSGIDPIECHPVVNIDAAPGEVQKQIAAFVRECQRIRLYYQFGENIADLQSNILDAEASSPELTGTYYVGPRDAQVIVRRHGQVWHALTRALERLGRKHTNQRVGGWGPDLVTCDNSAPLLFEIKVTLTAADLQTAVGQLFLYEKLLGGRYCKVLVIPRELSEPHASAVQDLDLHVLGLMILT